MPFPTATGTPSYAGSMIPEVWTGKLLVKYYEATVLADISNTDYEGDIKNDGDTVHIRTTPNIVISDYVRGQKLNHQTPEPEVIDLLIDKGKTWSFLSDAVTEAQADYNYVDDWTTDSSEKMAIAIDTDVLAVVYADADANNKGLTAGKVSSAFNLGTTGTPLALDKSSIVDKITDLSSVMSEQNLPREGRWVVLPEVFCNMILKSDLKDASLSGDGTSIARNGRVGLIANITIYASNLLATTSDSGKTVFNCIFGHKSGLTFASQLIKNEGPMPHPDYFGDFYRGLQIYGFEVIKPESIGHLYAYAA